MVRGGMTETSIACLEAVNLEPHLRALAFRHRDRDGDLVANQRACPELIPSCIASAIRDARPGARYFKHRTRRQSYGRGVERQGHGGSDARRVRPGARSTGVLPLSLTSERYRMWDVDGKANGMG